MESSAQNNRKRAQTRETGKKMVGGILFSSISKHWNICMLAVELIHCYKIKNLVLIIHLTPALRWKSYKSKCPLWMSPSRGSVCAEDWRSSAVTSATKVHWAPSGWLSFWGQELHWRLLFSKVSWWRERLEGRAEGEEGGWPTGWLVVKYPQGSKDHSLGHSPEDTTPQHDSGLRCDKQSTCQKERKKKKQKNIDWCKKKTTKG